MNIAKILNDYLLENGLNGEVEAIYNDIFPTEEGDCLISRYEPSSSKELSFIDGSAVGSVTIAYYMRSKNAQKCRKVLNIICDSVDNLSCTSDDGTEIRFESQTLPSFISEDDKKMVVYSATIKADYNRKGE